MKKIVEVYKCPNCNGKLEKTDNPNIMCCPYCGTEFETEDVTEEGNAKEEAPKEEAVEKETPKEKKEENKPDIRNGKNQYSQVNKYCPGNHFNC